MDFWANVKCETEATRLHILSLSSRSCILAYTILIVHGIQCFDIRHFVEHLPCVVELGSKPMAHVDAACCQGLLWRFIINEPYRDAMKHAYDGIHVEIALKERIRFRRPEILYEMDRFYRSSTKMAAKLNGVCFISRGSFPKGEFPIFYTNLQLIQSLILT